MPGSRTQDSLDRFGRVLVQRVRDKAILDWTKMLDGRMKGEQADHVRLELQALDPDDIDAVRRLVPQIVDTVLHHLLWTLEQEESITVQAMTATGTLENLREISDGLAGELYGWIPRFSEEAEDEN